MKIIALLMLLAAGPVWAAPSFDCGKAGSKAERAICASREASALDSEVAEAYRLALSRLADDAAAVARLKADQKSFVTYRDRFIDNENLVLVDYLARRRDFLLSIDPTVREGVEGGWRSFWGMTRIVGDAKGNLSVANFMSEPILRSWNCGDPNETAAGRLERGALLTGARDDGMRYSRKGRLLMLAIVSEPGVESSASCGYVGAGTDAMFPVMSAQAIKAEDRPAARPAPRAAEKKLIEVLHLLPTGAFDDTVDGIEAAELQQLLARGASENWQFRTVSDSKAVATSRRPFNEVHLTRKTLEGTDVVEARTLTQKAISYTYWAVGTAGKPLARHQPGGRARILNETGDGSDPIVAAEIPAPIHQFIEKLDQCQHWAGEVGDDLSPARQREIVSQMKKLGCATRQHDEKALKTQFRGEARWLGLVTRATATFGE